MIFKAAIIYIERLKKNEREREKDREMCFGKTYEYSIKIYKNDVF